MPWISEIVERARHERNERMAKCFSFHGGLVGRLPDALYFLKPGLRKAEHYTVALAE